MLYILGIAHFIAICGGIYALYNPAQVTPTINVNDLLSKRSYIKLAALPFVEELVFRLILPTVLNFIQFEYISYPLISGILFGLLHINNYPISGNKLLTINQVIFTTFLGYYLAGLNNFLSAVLMHYYFNMANIIVIFGAAIFKEFDNIRAMINQHQQQQLIPRGPNHNVIQHYVPPQQRNPQDLYRMFGN